MDEKEKNRKAKGGTRTYLIYSDIRITAQQLSVMRTLGVAGLEICDAKQKENAEIPTRRCNYVDSSGLC